MVHSPDSLSARGLLTGEFPLDRPASPAHFTVPASRIYRALARCYHARWDRKTGYRPPLPVISVGNIAVGGTGKTPFVIALVKLIGKIAPELTQPGAIAILSRGYRRRMNRLVVVEAEMNYRETGDEPLLIKRALPHAAVVVHADRAQAARFAVEELGARLCVLDDGFQHRRIARDLDLVLVDGEAPLGNGRCLPAGPLREPPVGLGRATVIVAVGESVGGAQELANIYGLSLMQVRSRPVIPTELSTKLSTPVFVLTSIARPSRFLNMLNKNGFNIVGQAAFRDHHLFTLSDIRRVIHRAESVGAQAIVTTVKDKIRLPDGEIALPIHVLGLTLEFDSERSVHALLEPILADLVKRSV